MRILLLSDIHANLEALEAALAAAPPFDAVVNLGDIVGYGASPNEVAERSRALGKVFVRGNHDKAATGVMNFDDFNPMAAAAAIWTRDQLTPENLEWLRGLPQGPSLCRISRRCSWCTVLRMMRMSMWFRWETHWRR